MEYGELRKWAKEHLTVDGEPLVLPDEGTCKFLKRLLAAETLRAIETQQFTVSSATWNTVLMIMCEPR